jgi:hypothetical protein
MVGSLAHLLGESIDYAGTFPPASLGLGESFERFERYISGPDDWIVSRFSCASSDLGELSRLASRVDPTLFIPVAVVGGAPADRAEWEAKLGQDAIAMNRFDEGTPDHVEIASYEIRIPEEVAIESYLKDLRGFSEVDVFVEIPLSDNLERTLAVLAETEWAYAKARIGSDTPPDPALVSRFISECLALELPFKLTAGMHAPISANGAYGFINVLGGTALSVSEDLSRRELETILRDDDRVQWHFDDDSIRFKGWEAGVDSILSSRDSLLCFGSCSVEQPLAGLASIGFSLPGEASA